MNLTVERFRLMGDAARLRILRLLRRERLNVGELTSILGTAQSGVSRNLKLLKDGGLVVEEPEGGFTYYRAVERPELELVPEGEREDEARLQEVLRHRKEEFREHGSDGRLLVPGRSWAAWARGLGRLLPPWRVADVGCGEGYLAVEMARFARRVWAVDRSAEMLRKARALAHRKGVGNIAFRRGSLEDLPFDRASFDLVLLAQVLHHAKEPVAALREAARVLVKGGRVLVLDLREHREEWVRSKLGDRWLGFKERTLRRLLLEAGFSGVRVEVGARKHGDPFKVLVASGVRR